MVASGPEEDEVADPARVLSALMEDDATDAPGVLSSLERVLREEAKADAVGLWLADYRRTALLPLTGAGAMAIDGTPAGRAFAAQEPVPGGVDPAGGCWLYLPLSVRGDRLGVLGLHLLAPPGPTAQAELAPLAAAAAYALVVAGRDTDLFERAARTTRLSLAAEIQWQLLPARSCVGEGFSLAGQLEPAYQVAGDTFGWSRDAGQLWIAVTDGVGRGTPVALLVALATIALRNARLAGLGLADQASLADQALYAVHSGEGFVNTLLLGLELATGQVAVVGAGSPLLWRVRSGRPEPVELDRQLPLGMFEGTHYVEERFSLAPGDRLVALSDGIHAARSPREEEFGEAGLHRALQAIRLLPPAEAVRHLMAELVRHHEGAELRDDAVAVVADWTG